MSENKHTPEPWAIYPDDRPNMHWNNHIVSEANPNIAICFMAHDGTEQNERGEANARRVVACVNRLAQFTTEQIEDFGYDLFAEDRPRLVEAQNEIHLLKKQRDELLAALEEAARVCIETGSTKGSCDAAFDIADACAAAIRAMKEKQ